jgi:hypothetical protein
MWKITNKTKSPVQLMIKSKRIPKAMTAWNIPGVGSGKNVVYLEDELKTSYVDWAESQKLIAQQYISNVEFNKGE